MPPSITCPANIFASVVNATDTAVVNYPVPTVTGFPTPDVTFVPPSGSAFPVGTTVVTVAATNSVGTNICTFTVSVCAPTIVVVNTNDSGAGSLRQAIADVCPDGTITFDTNGVFAMPQIIGLISGDLVIAKGLNIVGPGTNLLSISGNHASRIFQINGHAANPITNTISGLTLRDGNGSGSVTNTLGGAIYSFGAALTLAHCTLISNSAALYGGGLYAKLGSVTLTHCTFSSNTAYTGGGIFAVSNRVTLTHFALSGNSATGFDAYGGGIYTEFSTVELTDSAVSGNSAIGAGGVGFGSGGGICTVRGNLTLSNSIVIGNVANLGGGGIYYSDNSDHSLTLTQCSITGNSASDGGGISAFGGSATLTRCQVSVNSARYGGGIRAQALTLAESTVSGNSAVEEGGGMHCSFVALTQCTVSGNRATNSYGGGIFSYDAVLLTHCTVSGNSATFGGGILSSFVALNNSIVAGNFAGTTPDDIYGNFSGISGTYNLIGDPATSGGLTNGIDGNIVGNAGVGTRPIASILNTNLADNGGSTLTHALVPGSPAINAGAPAFVPPPDFDQRVAGFPRVLAGRLDIGAFELEGIAPSIACSSDVTVTNAYGQCCSLVAFAASASGLPEPTLTYALGGTNITSPYAFSIGTNFVVGTASNSFGMTQCVFTVTVLDPGPACLLVWKFDEASGLTALDSSGNANLGVLLKGPMRTSGVVGRSLRFDGSDDHVNATNPTSLNVTGAFTVACWIKPENASDSRYIVIKGDSSDKKYAYGIRTSSGKIQYRWVSPSGSESVFQTANKVISNGVWTHIAVAHTPGSAPKIFINGIVVPGSQSSGSATALIRPASKAFSAGATSDERDEFKGTIDEVFVCLSALKAGQIQNLTNGLPPGPPPPPPVVGIATASPLSGGIAGSSYSASLVATGGTPGFTWSIVSGALPAGLTLNPNTGAITGTPTAGTVNTFRARVIDSVDLMVEKDFSLTIITPPPCVVHYKFEETGGMTALDSSGSGNHGTLLNGPARTGGVVGRALRFDGSNDRVNGGNAVSFNLNSALILAAWIRPESVSGTRIVMIKGELDDENYAWALDICDAKLQYRWVNRSGDDSIYQSANNVLASGRWTHIAVTHTPGSAPLLYTNGVLVSSTRKAGFATDLIGVTSKPFTVGSSSDGDDRFIGIIDEVFVCRDALDSVGLIKLMAGLSPDSSLPPVPSPSPFIDQIVAAPLSILVSAGSAIISWASQPGQIYRVQYRNSLDDSEWLDLTGDIYADDEFIHIEDFLDEQPQRFYRVLTPF